GASKGGSKGSLVGARRGRIVEQRGAACHVNVAGGIERYRAAPDAGRGENHRGGGGVELHHEGMLPAVGDGVGARRGGEAARSAHATDQDLALRGERDGFRGAAG